MKFLSSLLSLVIVVATVAVGVLFALQNTTPVPLDLLVYNFSDKSVALWVLSALAIGGVLGLLMSSALALRLRSRLASARRERDKLRGEVERLRNPRLADAE